MNLKNIVILLLVGLVSFGLGYSVKPAKVTPLTYVTCSQSKEVQLAVQIEMFKMLGFGQKDMLAAVTPDLDKETSDILKKQIKDAFSKEYPSGFALEVLVDCLNK